MKSGIFGFFQPKEFTKMALCLCFFNAHEKNQNKIIGHRKSATLDAIKAFVVLCGHQFS